MVFTFDIYHRNIILRNLTCFMKIYQAVILLTITVSISASFTYASAEIPDPRIVHALVSSPVSVFGKTYPIQVDNSTYNIYYGFKFTYANASKISFVPVHNSIQISLNGVTETDAMWIQFPQNLISAENNNFVLYVDGQERKYELATSEHSTIMGFTVPTNTTLVEIQGTHVVPEFPFLVPILLSSIIFVIAFYRIRFRPT